MLTAAAPVSPARGVGWGGCTRVTRLPRGPGGWGPTAPAPGQRPVVRASRALAAWASRVVRAGKQARSRPRDKGVGAADALLSVYSPHCGGGGRPSHGARGQHPTSSHPGGSGQQNALGWKQAPGCPVPHRCPCSEWTSVPPCALRGRARGPTHRGRHLLHSLVWGHRRPSQSSRRTWRGPTCLSPVPPPPW